MARDLITPRQNAPGSDRVIEQYLAALDAALWGPRRTRAAVLDEINDGLRAAIDRQISRGVPATLAAHAAVTEFGPPDVVAHAFGDELATAHARRTLAALILTGPLVGVWWLLLLAPHTWPPDPATLWAAIPALPLIGAAILTALTALATTGALTRWLPQLPPRRALRATTAVGLACLAVDLTMLATLMALVLTPQAHPLPLIAAAGSASLLRLSWAGHVVSRCRRAASVLN